MPLGNRPALLLLLLGVLAPGLLLAQTPYLVRDINTTLEWEKGFPSPAALATPDGIYYVFDDGRHGPELWRTTSSGASLVRDLCPGLCGSSPRDLAELDGKVYFFADDGTTGEELWRTDGTPGGTTLVLDRCPGPCPGAGSPMVLAGDALFFRAPDGNGLELWTSDGTGVGTRQVADICPGCNA
ncbi:MAG TPA: hypothetical protein VF179_26230, partial [Thermoanaerobaculia bacterium]|nr:hypothetical protein [Thermoanaerobaculia bacterium]